MSNFKPWDYIVIISDHNITETFACLHFRPKRVITVATKAFKKQSIRFQEVLKKKLPGIQFYDTDTDGLIGESFYETTAWIPNNLTPHFCPQHKQVLNVTGGTKALSIALEKGINWFQVHYRSWNSRSIEIWEYAQSTRELKQNLLQDQKFIEPVGILIEEFSVDDACLLYLDRIEKDKTLYFKPEFPIAIQTMEAMWACLDQPEHPHSIIAKQLALHWYEKSKDETIDEWALLPWESVLSPTISKAAMSSWCNSLAAICDDILKIEDSGLRVRLKFNKNITISKKEAKRAFDQQKWLISTWLEDLVYHWLNDAGIPANHLHTGMYIKTDKESEQSQGSERELDICLFYHQAIYIIEIKAGFKSRNDYKEAIRQLASITAIIGAKRILFLGPWATKIYNENKDENESIARGCNIHVITDKTSLLSKFNLGDI